MVLCLLGMIYSMDSWTVKPNERGRFHSQGIKFSIFLYHTPLQYPQCPSNAIFLYEMMDHGITKRLHTFLKATSFGKRKLAQNICFFGLTNRTL